MPEKRDGREKKFWEFNPGLFNQLERTTFLQRHVVLPLRRGLSLFLPGLLFAYPIVLIMVGLLYGGLVFWASFVGSALVIYVALKSSGYAGNFAGRIANWRKFLASLVAFPAALGFFLALVYSEVLIADLRLLLVPVLVGLFVVGLVLVRRQRNTRTQNGKGR